MCIHMYIRMYVYQYVINVINYVNHNIHLCTSYIGACNKGNPLYVPMPTSKANNPCMYGCKSQIYVTVSDQWQHFQW